MGHLREGLQGIVLDDVSRCWMMSVDGAMFEIRQSRYWWRDQYVIMDDAVALVATSICNSMTTWCPAWTGTGHRTSACCHAMPFMLLTMITWKLFGYLRPPSTVRVFLLECVRAPTWYCGDLMIAINASWL